MQLPVEQFPVLGPGQMNPYHQALQTGLEGYQNNMKTAYMPYALQADIASKQAYAQNLSRQIASTVLSNPMTVASMMGTDAGKAQMANLIQQITSGPSQIGTPLPGQDTGQVANQGGGAWDKFTSFLKGDNVNTPSAQVSDYLKNNPDKAQQLATQGQTVVGGTNPGYDSDAKGSNIVSPSSEVKKIADNVPPGVPTTTTGSPATDDLYNAALAKMFPLSQQAIERKAKSAATTEAATAPIDINKETQKEKINIKSKALQVGENEANAITSEALAYQKNLDAFHNSYMQSILRGPYGGGVLAAFGPESSKMSNPGSQLQVSAASTAFGNRITNAKLSLAKQLKLDAKMKPEAELAGYNRLSALNNRQQEYGDFLQYAEDHGVSDISKIRNMFNDYNRDLPVYDGKEDKVIDNLGKYPQYIDKQLGKSSKNRTYNPQTGRIE